MLSSPDRYTKHAEEVDYVEDTLKWKEGAKQFKLFWNQLNENQRNLFSPEEKGSLQALFLGEKPAVSINRKEDLSADFIEIIQLYGLRSSGTYIYHPKRVRDILITYQKEYQALQKKHPWKSEYEFMQLLETLDSHYHMERGLILGYPYSACVNFPIYTNRASIQNYVFDYFDAIEKEYSLDAGIRLREILFKEKNKQAFEAFIHSHQKVPLHNDRVNYIFNYASADSINIHGIIWIDFGGSSQESIDLQIRLKKAFEQSGILE